ncbi:prepilin-type N-terminal cleavage/methylation domain-containing protein [Thalassotalea piscium]
MINTNKTCYKRQTTLLSKGFTLIELIVVIIILGIVSVTVAPKFFSSNGFEQVTYRNEIVSTLRAIQLRTMQQTSGNYCHLISVSSYAIGLNKTDTNNPLNCDLSALEDDTKDEFSKNTSVAIEDKHKPNVNFSVNGLANVFGFDQLGRIINSSGNRVNCNPCQIVITGSETLIVKIENEGYIHAL